MGCRRRRAPSVQRAEGCLLPVGFLCFGSALGAELFGRLFRSEQLASVSARCRRGGQGSAVLLAFPCKRVCFSTAVPELENGIAGFDTKSLTMHPSQSPSSLRQRPEQRSASRSLSRSTASTSAPACPPGARLDDVPVSPANKKLGKALGGAAPVPVPRQVAAGQILTTFSAVSLADSGEACWTLILMQANVLRIIWPPTRTLLLFSPMHSGES